MQTLRQNWERIVRRLTNLSKPYGHHAAAPKDIACEISAVSSENQALAEQVQRFRTDFKRSRDEEDRKIADLEQVRQSLAHARSEDHRKLAELESINSRLVTDRETDSTRILDQERRLVEIEAERNLARDQVTVLETSLAETTSRLEKTDSQIRHLQASAAEQAQQFESSLSEVRTRLDSADNQITVLGVKLKNEHQHYLQTSQDIQDRFSKQDLRMNWVIMVAGLALVLGAFTGVFLVRDAQKNAAMLSIMSRDIRELTTSMKGDLSLQHRPLDETPQSAVTAISTNSRTEVTAAPSNNTVVASQHASSVKTTDSTTDPNPFNSLDRPRRTYRAGERKFTRRDAKKFFEDNAANEGVVSLSSGVQYRVVMSGNGNSPSLSDQVMVAYVGIRPDGSVFDETYSKGAPKTISMNEVMPGWQEVLQEMQEGAEFELYVPPNLTPSKGVRKRGMSGFEPSIYLIELLQVVKNDTTGPSAPAN